MHCLREGGLCLLVERISDPDYPSELTQKAVKNNSDPKDSQLESAKIFRFQLKSIY